MAFDIPLVHLAVDDMALVKHGNGDQCAGMKQAHVSISLVESLSGITSEQTSNNFGKR